MSKRFQAFDELSECWTVVDQKVLTKEYGGSSNDNEVKDDFRKLIFEKLVDLNKFMDYEIDLPKAEAMKNMHESSNVGSFRKLEID